MYTSALKPFVINGTDIQFMLDQVRFRPLYDASHNFVINWDGTTAIYDKSGLLLYTPPANEVAGSTTALAALDIWGTSYQTYTDLAGLRDPSGMNNNLAPVHAAWGAVDQIFPRMVHANYSGYIIDPNGKVNNGVAGGLTSNSYAITASGTSHASDGTAITINNITDGSPRSISLAATTAGVTFESWGDPAHLASLTGKFQDSHGIWFGYDASGVLHSSNEIYYDTSGVAAVKDWGQLETVANGGLGQVDTQARLASSAGQNDHFVGGLNPGVSPSNGFFVLFGQFFDHGLDFIGKGEQGKTITITLDPHDPLYGMVGPDGQPTTTITIARANVQTIDASGQAQSIDKASPFIDQSQTYGSHQQVTDLLREWVIDPASADQYNEHPGMKMFDGTTLATAWTKPDGTLTHDTLPTLNELRWAMMDSQRTALSWEDMSNLRNRDANGIVDNSGNSGSALLLDSNPRFDLQHLHMDATTLHLDGPTAAADATFEADYMNGIVDSSIAALNVSLGGHATLTIGTHPGDKLTLTVLDGTFGPQLPSGTILTGASALAPWVNFSDFSINTAMAPPNGTIISGFDVNIHDAVGNILLASVGDHYIAGDGRTNENIGLTSIHHVFHEEHNFQVQNFMDALHRESIVTNSQDNLHSFQVDTNHGATNAAGDYVNSSGEVTWDMDKMFQASKLIVEMEYQHAAVDQYARNVTPNIQEFVGYSPDKDPSVTLEYSQSIFRWGHSTLRETIDTIDPDHGLTGKIMGYALRSAFLNPEQYAQSGAASILMGMTHQQMNEVDEFVTPALNQGLLGQPLDLAAINIARGRDLGIPTLNDFRVALGMSAYTSWTDFGNNMQHPSSLVNFIAAYDFDGDPNALAKAQEIIDLADGVVASGTGANRWTAEQAVKFLDNDTSPTSNGDPLIPGSDGFNHIDTWLGGLAEVHQPGGILGETFDKVFVTQIESLMDGDRFYYLFRLAGQQFAAEVGGGQLKDLVERNTGLTHLNGNIFGYADQYIDLGAKRDTSALIANGGEATSLSDTTTLTADHTMLAINSGNTVSNEHKYGDIAGVDAGTLGVYSNGGRSSVLDGTTVTIGGTTYIRDTRLADSNPDSAYAANGGVNLDGTPNSGAESNEVIVGTKAADLIYAQGGDDTVYGEDGNDTIYGGYGIDRLYGGGGSDHIYGGDNPDLIDGGTGDDFLYGESSGTDINGADQLEGGSGNDLVDGGVGIDKLNGGSGDDHVVGGQDTDPFTHGGDGNDLVEGNSGGDILYGDNGDDLLVGGADQDQMFGGNGDDIIRPGDPTGALTIGTDETLGGDGTSDINPDGTIGFDIIDFSDNTARPGGVTFDLSAQTNPAVTVNGQPTQTQSFQMEGVIGSVSGDTLTSGSDHLDAAGNDVVDNDWLIGGTGSDTLVNSINGSGNDVIIGGSIRLDALVGQYHSGYTHNNNNTGLTQADQLQDALYQGASHRVDYAETIDGSGFLSKYNAANSTGVQYDATHFTEMLRSDQFKDLVLGNATVAGVADADTGSDKVVFNGQHDEYTIVALKADGTAYTAAQALAHLNDGTIYALRVTDNGGPDPADPTVARASDGTDLIIGVEQFSFSDGAGGTETYTLSDLFLHRPKLDLHAFDLAGNFADNFNTVDYLAETGSLTFNAGWVETGDGTTAEATGQIRENGTQLRFVGGTGSGFDGASIERALDLSPFDKATISYSVGKTSGGTGGINNIGATENVKVYFTNDGVTYDLIDTIVAGSANGTHSAQIAAPTGGFGNAAALKFEVTGMTQGANSTSKYISIENLNIDAYTAAPDGNSYAVQYIEPGTSPNGTTGAQFIALNASITDADNPTLASATITLTNAKIGDTLGVSGTLPAGLSGSGTVTATVAGTLTLTLTGAVSPATYQAALAQVRFYSSSDAPDVTPRNINVTVSDGTLSSAVSHTIVTVTPTNDGPVVGVESIITTAAQFTAGFTVPDWAFLANDKDPEGNNPLSITGTGPVSGLTASHANSQITIINGNGNNDRFQYTASDSLGAITPSSNISVTTANTIFTGGAGSQILVGGTANETFDGLAGSDVIFAGAGTDTLRYTVTVDNLGALTSGRDIIDGGAGTDTFVLSGVTGTTDYFRIYSASAWTALGAGHTLTNIQSGIVVTRTTTGSTTVTDADVIAELRGVEEIRINGNTPASPAVQGSYTGPASGDHVDVIGNFTNTGLAYSTITVNGDGNTVDITQLTSDHRVVLNGEGSSIVGDVRPQDVVNQLTVASSGDTGSVQSFGGETVTAIASFGDGSPLVSGDLWHGSLVDAFQLPLDQGTEQYGAGTVMLGTFSSTDLLNSVISALSDGSGSVQSFGGESISTAAYIGDDAQFSVHELWQDGHFWSPRPYLDDGHHFLV